MNHTLIKQMLIEAGKAVRQRVVQALSGNDTHTLSQVHAEKKEDTIYVIDREVEGVLIDVLEKYSHELGGLVVLAEGVGEDGGGIVLPKGTSREQAKLRIIIDPIDGTRGIMYDKRPAFFLAGAASNKDNTNLSDIEVAVMVELPTSKQHKADVLWAVKGNGSFALTDNLFTNETTEKSIRPSSATSIIGGFAQFARFFPPGREILSAMEDELIHTLVPTNPSAKALVFEDQYISSGGQLYELLMGHDRFIADIRGLLYRSLKKQGKEGGHVCHPYDVCAHLIGKEAGIILTDGTGEELNSPLDLTTEINWIGYANKHIEHEVKPILLTLLQKHNLV